MTIMMDISLMAPTEIVAQLGSRLRDRRLRLNITQREVAKRAGLSLGTLRNLEARPQSASFETVVRVAMALDLVRQFESLFHQPVLSIADLERAVSPPRHRARSRNSA